MHYSSKPIDTSNVTLPVDLIRLTDHLAEHNHQAWAARRASEGWTYGPLRDDTAKKHPGLIPYADLPEFEKEYDRTAAIETLKAIVALGYRIEKP